MRQGQEPATVAHGARIDVWSSLQRDEIEEIAALASGRVGPSYAAGRHGARSR